MDRYVEAHVAPKWNTSGVQAQRWQLSMACIASGSEEIQQQQQCLAGSSLGASTTSLNPSQSQQASPPDPQASGINSGQPGGTEDAQTQPVEATWLVAEDVDGLWKHLRNMSPQSAMLIRPDGHIAWRCESFSPAADVSNHSRHQSGGFHAGQYQASNRSASAGTAEPESRARCRKTEVHGLASLGTGVLQQTGLLGLVSGLVTDQERSHAEKLVSDALQSLLH